MSHFGGWVQDDPKKVEKVKLAMSSEFHSKGKDHWKDNPAGIEPTDAEITSVEIYGAVLTPSSYNIPSVPIIRNQGDEGSCVVFTLTYAARSIEEYLYKGQTSFSNSVNVFSPEFVYNQTKFGSCTAGTSFVTVLDFMKNTGSCLWNTMPYSSTNGCDILPNQTQYNEATNFKVGTYSKILVTDITGIKTLISQNRPVAIGISADNNFVAAGVGFIWSAATAASGGALAHAVLIVGYDDAKNAYKVMNSWGTAWGDAGFSYIDYDFLLTKSGTYAYFITSVISTATTVPTNIPPVANAGPDKTIPSNSTATMDGTASYDSDGTINTWLWERVSGPSSPAITGSTSPVASITPSVAGTYVYKLTVTDNSGDTNFDTMSIVVTALETNVANLSVTKTVAKGKTSDNLSWQISTTNPAQSAAIEIQQGTSFVNFYTISPYSAQGSYKYVVGAAKTATRYYRLKVVKSDGSFLYSSTISIK